MEPITADSLLQGVRSFCPGRLRLRLPLLRGASDEFVGMIRDALTAKEGVTGVDVNPRVGSLLLTWDPAVLTLEPQALAEEAAGMLEMARMMGYFDEKDESCEEKCCACEGACAEGAGSECACGCGAEKKACTCGCQEFVDTAKVALDRAQAGFERVADAPLQALARVIAPDVTKGARAKRVAQNRLMLGLLAVSIAVLATGRAKGAHTGFGAGFLGLLAVHLLQHRRVL